MTDIGPVHRLRKDAHGAAHAPFLDLAAQGHRVGCAARLRNRRSRTWRKAWSPARSAGFLLIEQVWARDLKRAIRDAVGIPVGRGIPHPGDSPGRGAGAGRHAEALEAIEKRSRPPPAPERRRDGTLGNASGDADGGAPAIPDDVPDAAPAAPAAPAEPDYVSELERLAQLRDQGVITAEDFDAKKGQLLGL